MRTRPRHTPPTGGGAPSVAAARASPAGTGVRRVVVDGQRPSRTRSAADRCRSTSAPDGGPGGAGRCRSLIHAAHVPAGGLGVNATSSPAQRRGPPLDAWQSPLDGSVCGTCHADRPPLRPAPASTSGLTSGNSASKGESSPLVLTLASSSCSPASAPPQDSSVRNHLSGAAQ
jgi:hypothetical protein